MSRHQNKTIDNTNTNTNTNTNINDFNNDGYTPLMCLIENNKPDILEEAEKLMVNGADINLQTEDNETEIYGDSALSLAIKKGNYKVVKFLLDNGANKKHSVRSDFYNNGDYKTGKLIEKTETLIEIAIRYGDENIINILKK